MLRKFPSLPLCFCLLLLIGGYDHSKQSVEAASSHTYRPGAVLVQLQPQSNLRALAAALPINTRIDADLGNQQFSVQVPSGQESAYASMIGRLPHIKSAQLDHRIAAQIQPNDTRYNEQWGMARLGMPAVWDVVTDTNDLVIATLDTGIRLDHPELQQQLWTNTGEIPANGIDDDQNGQIDDIHGWHFYHVVSNFQVYPRDDNDLADPNGHGTHVAGIIAAQGNNSIGVAGIAWKTRLMVLRVLEADTFGWESDLIRGLAYASNNGAKIINMSLGLAEPSPLLADAIQQTQAHGILVVAAAGNTGTVLYPAGYQGVVSVGAMNSQDQVPAFSARGDRLDVVAPGVDILSTWNGQPYIIRSGTSMAAPHVTGIAALVWRRIPSLSAQELRRCLLWSANDIGTPGRDAESGWGVINPLAALQSCPYQLYMPIVEH